MLMGDAMTHRVRCVLRDVTLASGRDASRSGRSQQSPSHEQSDPVAVHGLCESECARVGASRKYFSSCVRGERARVGEDTTEEQHYSDAGSTFHGEHGEQRQSTIGEAEAKPA